jgi:PEP phosphonomutase and related enzymes
MLRKLFAEKGIIVAPGTTTALYAKIIEDMGFKSIFVTGAGLANMHFGLPDYALTTMTENLELVKRINDNTTLPLIVDIDDGYGNPMNVYRTGKEFSALDVGAVVIEDQKAPKRCGHFEDHQVISIEDMQNKIKALREGSTDSDLVVFARTDAISVNGIDDAIERAHRFIDAGADAIFIEAPRTIEQMRMIPKNVPAPCLVNIVEGGKTPLVPNEALQEMGFKVVIYANAPLKASIRGMKDLLQHLKDTGTTANCDDNLMITMAERNIITRKEFYKNLQMKYK